MDEALKRVLDRVSQLPGGKGREVAWLAEKLGSGVQRVSNWKTRGLPAKELLAIGNAIGWTPNQILGVDAPPTVWPFETIDQERWKALTPRQKAMVEVRAVDEVQRIESSQQKRQVNGP